ncbi:SDR family NAD(P)-dependent oxidoreductase [Streptomyces pseudovenezuelae]|uniref:NAD(P)-dependent dehydrogenase (Short-subunit alcohol dehydrogenase family) n=1 Tax=Streptomyces pseudovenezuelae TaxID=67350 RepID=A0ABT6LNH1_9ACTN|nr:SDR family oxidoreductase [Streptomyces pseudovenezuelae]MDH6216884.1 NAD(P)-dependent dehydrogenase (short-subunit alcohol dehydrogenase family) [Streptomyces pseudovenezuelae]
MKLDLEGKTALITGASRGIGLEIARSLVAEGAQVVGGARNVSEELRAVTPYVHSVDLATEGGPAELVDLALSDLGGIDILVNNLGFPYTRPQGFLSVDDKGWEEALNLNLMTAVRTTRAALPSIIERQGSIVSLGSTNAHTPVGVVVDYSAAKAALLNLGKALAEEFGPRGVRVNTVAAGPVMTDAWTGPGGIADTMAEQSGLPKDEVLGQVPDMLGSSTGQNTTAQEIAAVVTFLVSRKAPNANGAEWIVDGGFLKSI